MPSRRDLLRASGLALSAGLAGCVYTGAFPWATVSVSVGAAFENDPSVDVPVAVDIELQNVDDERVAMRNVHVALFNAQRRRIGLQHLGDFSWRGAPESQRRTEEVDVTFGSQTVYHAAFSETETVSTDRVPAWVTVRLDELSFGGDAAIDAARNTTPPPKLRAYVPRYRGARPAPSTVSPDSYESVEVRSYDGVTESGVVLPPLDTGQTAGTADANGTRTGSGVGTTGETSQPTTQSDAA